MSTTIPAQQSKVRFQEERLNLIPGPLVFAQEFQAGFNARLPIKTADIDPSAEFIPAIVIDQLVQQIFQRDAVQRIIGLLIHIKCTMPLSH